MGEPLFIWGMQAQALGGISASGQEVHGQQVLCQIKHYQPGHVHQVPQGGVPQAQVRGWPSVHTDS